MTIAGVMLADPVSVKTSIALYNMISTGVRRRKREHTLLNGVAEASEANATEQRTMILLASMLMIVQRLNEGFSWVEKIVGEVASNE